MSNHPTAIGPTPASATRSACRRIHALPMEAAGRHPTRWRSVGPENLAATLDLVGPRDAAEAENLDRCDRL